MRVKCICLEDFLDNLRKEPKEAVYRNLVYVNRTDQPLDGTRDKAVRFMVNLSLHAVVDVEDGGQYLLELQTDCGVDYHDGSKERLGTEELKRLMDQVEKFCEDAGLFLRPGVVDF